MSNSDRHAAGDSGGGHEVNLGVDRASDPDVGSAPAPSSVAMIFEFWFDPDRPDLWQEYLGESDRARELVGDIDGFLGVERFQSTVDPNKYLAIGFFTDEAAVTAWRTTTGHRRIQALGRHRLFTRYRLRMADVTRDYDAHRRAEAPRDSRAFHDRRQDVTDTHGDIDREDKSDVRR